MGGFGASEVGLSVDVPDEVNHIGRPLVVEWRMFGIVCVYEGLDSGVLVVVSGWRPFLVRGLCPAPSFPVLRHYIIVVRGLRPVSVL